MSSKSFALITGTCGGIGQALVKGFNNAGYSVIATDIKPLVGDLLCEKFLVADLQKIAEDESYANEFFSKVRAIIAGDGIKVLVNNAAEQILGGVTQLSRSDWYKTLHTNLLAPFFLIQAFLPELTKAQGSIVNISSIHAKLTKKNFVAYATSKAALSSLTRNLAVDLGGKVRVNAIEPAAVATSMLEAGFDGKKDILQQLNNLHPMGRIARPEEVAEAALFLASNKIGFLHGTCLELGGGIFSLLHDLDSYADLGVVHD